MEGGKAVVDASVVVKWFIEEEYSREARLLRDAYRDGLIDLIAPSLLPYEVLNALKYSNVFGEEELKEIAHILDDFQITLYSIEGRLSELSVEIAYRKGVTIYDAAYVALAVESEAPLYTADEKLLRKTRSTGLVRHISGFEIP